jgi:hypothetical protein
MFNFFQIILQQFGIKIAKINLNKISFLQNIDYQQLALFRTSL